MVKLVVFFMVVALAKSFGNKCDVPPEFWCGSEKVARHCQVGLLLLFLPAKLLAKTVTKKCICYSFVWTGNFCVNTSVDPYMLVDIYVVHTGSIALTGVLIQFLSIYKNTETNQT